MRVATICCVVLAWMGSEVWFWYSLGAIVGAAAKERAKWKSSFW